MSLIDLISDKRPTHTGGRGKIVIDIKGLIVCRCLDTHQPSEQQMDTLHVSIASNGCAWASANR